MPELAISPEKLAYIIEKAREYDVKEAETDQADVSAALELIQLGAGGNEGREKLRLDGVIQHREHTPLRREKRG